MKSENKISVLNITSSILLKGIAFFTTPIISRMLGTAQYGLYSLFQFRLEIISCVIGLGLVSSIGTAIHEYNEDYQEYRSSSLLLTTLSSLGFIIIANIFIRPISVMFNYDIRIVEYILFLALFYVIVNYAQTVFIYEKKAEHNFVMSLLLSIITVVLSIYIIPRLEKSNKYLGMVYGQMISYGIVAVIVWLMIFIKKPTRIKKEYTLYGLTYGIPVVFHLLSHSVLSQSDREMMDRMGVSKHELGVYSLFFALTSVLSVIVTALSNSLTPFYLEGIKGEKWNDLDIKCKNIFEVFTVCIVGFLMLSREVSLFISSEEFWEGQNIIPLLTISIFFIFLYQFPVCYEFYYKKTRVVAIATAICAVVNILLNLIMIPLWGMYGAGFTTAISYLLLFLIHYIFVVRMSKGKYHLKIYSCIPWFIIILISSACFYIFAKLIILRWCIAVLVGMIELYRIVKRKSIF